MLSAADRKGAEGVDGTTSEFKKEGVVQRDRGVLTAVDEQSHILKWLNIEKIIPCKKTSFHNFANKRWKLLLCDCNNGAKHTSTQPGTNRTMALKGPQNNRCLNE